MRMCSFKKRNNFNEILNVSKNLNSSNKAIKGLENSKLSKNWCFNLSPFSLQICWPTALYPLAVQDHVEA